MGWRRNRRALRLGVDRVTAEAEAIVRGRVVERGQAGEIPTWVRLNELGHGDWEHITTLAAGADGSPVRSWDGAVRFLAGELVNLARDPASLVKLQRSAVIPLELALLSGDPEPPTPTELVQLVRTRVAQARHGRTLPVPSGEGAPIVRRAADGATWPTHSGQRPVPGVTRLPKSG